VEVIEGVARLISEHGIITVLSAVALGGLIWKGKSIGAFIVQTLQASAIVKKNEEIIEGLRQEIQELRSQLDEMNQILINQSATIARLEERIVQTAKKRVSKRRAADEN
jgi:flagellar motility protein MotE (MotC chaperone)